VKAKRFLFISAVVLISAVCLAVMNINYDRLSRYPYEDKAARALIEEYFSNKDIEYIIEYSISPSEFIDFISYPGFSIYHAAEYNQIRNSVWYLDNEQVVKIVELAREKITMEELISFLIEYDGQTVMNYFSLEDTSEIILIKNPSDASAYVDDVYTVHTRILFDALPVVSLPSKDVQVTVAGAVLEPVKNMCMAIETELDLHKTCGGLIADAGYVSYDEQALLFEEAKLVHGEDALLYADSAGHSEHQLGLALDFSVEGFKKEHFDDSIQYEWLKNNAHRFGFVQSYQKEKEEITGKAERSWHWRFVGYEMAAKMYFEHLSLKEAVYE